MNVPVKYIQNETLHCSHTLTIDKIYFFKYNLNVRKVFIAPKSENDKRCFIFVHGKKEFLADLILEQTNCETVFKDGNVFNYTRKNLKRIGIKKIEVAKEITRTESPKDIQEIDIERIDLFPNKSLTDVDLNDYKKWYGIGCTGKKFVARCKGNHIGTYDDLETAIIEYNNYVLNNNIIAPINVHPEYLNQLFRNYLENNQLKVIKES